MKQIPLMDMKAQISSIRNEINDAISKVLDSSNFILGPEVEKFETEFAKATNVSYAVACNSGTSALHLALVASGVEPGDEVIVPGMTFIATASAVIYAGATPVVVDISPETWTVDPGAVEAAITPRTTAIMPVHLHGRMADMNSIMKIAKKHDLLVIEDAAQAHLASRDGNAAGSVGNVAGFSFYPGKNLGACGEGGILTTNSEEISQKAKILRDWGASKKYHHDFFGFNYRMDALQGAILNVKLKHLEKWTTAREKKYNSYQQFLLNSGFELPKISKTERHAFHVLATFVKNRDEIILGLNSIGIGVGSHYPKGIHEHLGIQDKIKIANSLDVTNFFARHNLSLPIFPELSEHQIQTVCSNIIKNCQPAK